MNNHTRLQVNQNPTTNMKTRLITETRFLLTKIRWKKRKQKAHTHTERNRAAKMVGMFEVGPCENGYEMGLLIGQRFSKEIRSRLAKDLILQNQLLPFAHSPHSQSLLKSLTQTNMSKYPRYWDELRGTAQGSGSSFLQASSWLLCNLNGLVLLLCNDLFSCR